MLAELAVDVEFFRDELLQHLLVAAAVMSANDGTSTGALVVRYFGCGRVEANDPPASLHVSFRYIGITV